jgi:chloride channel protein, CIC family
MFELTRDYNAILPLMLATVIATLVAAALARDSIMTEKLTRRGLRVPSDYHADILHTAMVGELMTTHVETVHPATRVGEVARRFQTNGHGAYPLVDDMGRCVGIITRGDLLRDGDWSDDSPVCDVAARDVVSATPSDTAGEALDRILQEQVEHLPVVDDDRLVGICTRTDIMRARRTQWEHEQTEPSWRARRRSPK